MAAGNAALIAAGTGPRRSAAAQRRRPLHPVADRGRTRRFRAADAEEIGLLQEIIRLNGRADYERVLSGPGLVNVHRYVHPDLCPACDPSADPVGLPSMISRAALERRCPKCVESLRLFVAVYGAEAGNLAMRSVASAGLFVGGGIAPKILPALQNGEFMAAFRDKAPMADFVAAVPVAVILNDRTGLLGAAVHAAQAVAAR